MESTSH